MFRFENMKVHISWRNDLIKMLWRNTIVNVNVYISTIFDYSFLIGIFLACVNLVLREPSKIIKSTNLLDLLDQGSMSYNLQPHHPITLIN